MGKAAILVGPVVVIVLALIVWGIIRMIVKSGQEPKDVRNKAKLADEAYDLIRDMMFPQSIDDITLLSKDHRAKAESWAEKYGKVIR